MYVVSLFLATFFVWFLREGEFWGETGWVGRDRTSRLSRTEVVTPLKKP